VNWREEKSGEVEREKIEMEKDALTTAALK